jgi:hypothetical protein
MALQSCAPTQTLFEQIGAVDGQAPESRQVWTQRPFWQDSVAAQVVPCVPPLHAPLAPQ